jgi:hypothetical protein
MKEVQNVVYGERDLKAIISRSRAYNSFKRKKRFVELIKKLIQINKDTHNTYTIIVLGIETSKELSEFIKKYEWYLPSGLLNYQIIIETNLELSDNSINTNYSSIFLKKLTSHYYKKANLILLNKAEKRKSINLLKYFEKLVIIDSNYYSYTESIEWQNICYNSLTKEYRKQFLDLSIDNFNRFQLEKASKKKAYCFVTGPSFSEYPNFSYLPEDLIVICNSIVKNKEFLKRVGGADLLTFADPVFHFSYNKYSQVFREEVIETFRRYKCFVAVPIHVFPLFYQHYPELREHLIGMVFHHDAGKYNIPSKENFWVRDTANILATLMLPLASVVANEVNIIGADGRKPDEKYFWAHNPTVQFNDLMSTVFEAHPSFFRDRDYKDYYDEHCQHCQKLLSHAEKKGRNFFSLTPSYIPAFTARYRSIT